MNDYILYKVEYMGSYESDAWEELNRGKDPSPIISQMCELQKNETDNDISYVVAMKEYM